MEKTKKKNDKKLPLIKSPVAGSLVIEKLPGYFLIVCLILAFLALIWILRPFITVLMTAVVLTVVFYPIYKKVLKLFRGRETLASLFSCFLVFVIIIIPITLFIILMTSEAQETYKIISTEISSGEYDKYLTWGEGGYFFDLKNEIAPYFDLDQINLKQTILDVANDLKGFILNQTVLLLSTISTIALSIFLMFFSMYYFFKDGEKIVEKLGYISPLPSIYEIELFLKLKNIIKAIVFGVLLASIVQGVAGGIGFAIVGIQGAVFWGTMIAFASLIPVVGTAFVWVPASIILAISGQYWQAAVLFAWGVIIIGSIDNLIRPFLIQGAGSKTKMYPLLTFFVILGGVFTLGFKGIAVGPILLMILLTFLHVYQSEYSKVLKK
jgi:predicted PurR-regulated permease PerM